MEMADAMGESAIAQRFEANLSEEVAALQTLKDLAAAFDKDELIGEQAGTTSKK